MKIGLIGDVHADYSFWAFSLWKMHRVGIDTVVQLGDFGVGQTNYNRKFLDRASKLAVHYGITAYIVEGNHEDHVYLNELKKGSRTEFATLRPNLLIVPRGMRWTWDKVKFVALGGAPSIDLTWRKEEQKSVLNRAYHSWFPEEMITEEDLAYVAAGGRADVMFAHDAPKNVPSIDNRIASNPHGFNTEGLLHAADGRELMDRAFRSVAPDTFIHGHYHMPVNDMVYKPTLFDGSIQTREVKYTHVLGLGCNYDYKQYALGHYDTTERKAHMWNVTSDIYDYEKQGGNLK